MNKNLRFIIISPILGMLCYILAFYSYVGELPGFEYQLTGYLPSAVFGLWAGLSTLFVGKYLNKLVSWKQRHAIRFLIQSSVLYLIGLILIAIYSEMFLISLRGNLSYSQFWLIYNDEIFKTLLILFLVVLVYCIIDFMIYSFNQMREEEIKSVELMNNQLNLQFEALKSQLNPHFLFNSLNTISSLLYKDKKVAEKFIRMFAESYRFIFKQNNSPLIPLQKELDFVQSYNYLLQVRFQEAYELKINIPENAKESYVPPLSIQMLVENAIKHNLISQTSPLLVDIEIDNNYLCVKNNINPLREQPESFQIGIENIKKRYSYFTNDSILLDKNEHFKVRLPLILQS
ncbi:sensor histidine kinase [Marinifilum flexuosum]|uniref:Histidine kinase n=1 Tax=Marinifilum flexuosum TaxID=1117708 RepID=A0A419XB04_9BACT|nr:histidine kinase [Marinifilum flexuosum]RKE04938.1 histidine kinase [Marinifilum flexuosum]